MGRGWKSFGVHARKSLDCLEETLGENEAQTSGNWRKSDPSSKLAKNTAELGSSV